MCPNAALCSGLNLGRPSLFTWRRAIDQGTITAAEIADCLYSALDDVPNVSSHSKFTKVTREGLLTAKTDRFDELAQSLQDFKAAAELAIAAVDTVLKARAEVKQPEPQEKRPYR
jgi:hypothetical protein